MKKTDKLKEQLQDKIITMDELDITMEDIGYNPVEIDDNENNVIKYTNGKSFINVYVMHDGKEYMVTNITMSNKKRGSTTVRAFHTIEEIKGMMDWFRNNEQYDNFLTFMLGLFLARRVGDTLSLKWRDFYSENGRRKESLNTLIEDKTDKIVDMHISDITWKYIDWYCEKVIVDPMEHFDEDIFKSTHKDWLPTNYTKEQYDEAVEKMESAYRNQFKKAAEACGINGVSTHSTRKSFGYIAHEINRFDPDCYPVLQSVYGHNSVETTKRYIDCIREKANKMFEDVAKYIEDVDNGIAPEIKNLLIVALSTNDLRDVLYTALKLGRETNVEDDVESMNMLLSMVEEKRVS